MNPLLGGAALYGLAVGALYLMQDSLMFPRNIAKYSGIPLPTSTETLSLRTDEGLTIEGYLVPATQPSRGVLLGFAGNAWNAQNFTTFLADKTRDLDIVAFHYRGYAPSQGKPGEPALYADALLIHDHIKDRLQPERVIVAGFSLGSAVAAHLARERELDGLILVTPFDSIEAIARKRYFWAPVRALLRHRFATIEHLDGLDVPVAVISAGEDKIVPPDHTHRLAESLVRPMLVEEVPESGHGTLYDREEFDDYFRESLDLLTHGGAGNKDPQAHGSRDHAEPVAIDAKQ